MKLRTEITNVPLADLHAYEQNAKKHSTKQINLLAKGIARYGFNQPIVIDQHKEIVAGHGRYYAAQILNLEEVPCILVDDLTDAEIRAYRLFDNQLNAMTDMDMELTMGELRWLDSEGYDIELTGFDRDILIEPEEKDDLLPETPKKAQTKLGDLYEIGLHRVLCGDSTKMEDVEKLMGGEKAKMIFTDPPYNVNYSGRGKKTSRKIDNDNQTESAFREFLNGAFACMRHALSPRGGGLRVLCISNAPRVRGRAQSE